ncbi:MAG: glutamate--tRNA ligase [Actinomycetota bacterium]|nr:glutamate--tRNA ligase [Actinomycetota bacterium]
MKVRVRAAPAPSGSLHVGNVRTFLFNWLYARHRGGTFVLRIEDTDPSRFSEDAYQAVLEDLRWLGLEWDEGPEVGGPHDPYRQSLRGELYATRAAQLVESGSAYRCYCTPEELRQRREQALAEGRRPGYEGRCRALTPGEIERFEAEGRPAALRFKVPIAGEIVFHDLVIGRVATALDQIDDFVIVRSDGGVLYNLAVVVDDAEMAISHVIRGDDLLSNTPKQILLHEALGADPPSYAHLPQVLGADRKPLSKRHGSTSVSDFREEGYLPEALVNFLALLGWGTAHDNLLTKRELIERFTIEDVHPSPAMFETPKLDWMNGEYIRMLDDEDLTRRLEPWYVKAGLVQDDPSEEERKKIAAATPLVQTRIKKLSEAPSLVKGLFVEVEMDPAAVAKVMRAAHVPELIRRSADALENLDSWGKESVETALRGVAEDMGLKPRTAFGPIYVAISGSTVSAPIFDLIALIGKQDSVRRLRVAEAKSRELTAAEASGQ